MVIFRHLFLLVTILVSAAMAESSSCRNWKADMTECDPYATKFFKIVTLKRGIEGLRNQPVTKKEIPLTEKIRVKNGITLNNLIRKYIKREERLYDRAEKRRMEEAAPSKSIKKVEPKPFVPQKPKKILIEKPPKEKKTIPAQPKKVLVPIVLSPPVAGSQIKPSTRLDENNITKEDISAEEVILPAELTPAKKEPSKEVKQETREVFAIYIVKRGDSLLGIAKKFGLDIVNLAKINHLKKKAMLKVGQKLRIPLSQKLVNTMDNALYIVKKGDTLSSIAKRFKVKLKDLKKYNKIRKKSLIHIGQKLVLPLPHKLVQLKRIEKKKRKERLRKKRERERLARIALKKAKKAKFLKAAKGLKHRLSVTATAYTSHRGQTDSTPFLAAWNNRIRPGMKVIAVSRDLIYRYGITNGSKVRISGLSGIYTVRDKMNKKWRHKIDIYMGTSRWKALRWGRRRVMLYY